MAVNKLALVRYKILDQCFRDTKKQYTLDALVSEVSNALFEMEGIQGGVGKRTVQADIQFMRDSKFGYDAPIQVVKKKYYSYSNPSFSISNSPISESELIKLKNVLSTIKQINGIGLLDELKTAALRLENSFEDKQTDIIQFESSPSAHGTEWLPVLFNAIRNQSTLMIRYHSFKRNEPLNVIVSPYLMKEHRNRWFLFCKEQHSNNLENRALDRIKSIHEIPSIPFEPYEGVPISRLLDEVIGVTIDRKQRAQNVVFSVDLKMSPYIESKPLHHSQELIATYASHKTFRIRVQLNFELEKELLSLGESIKVLKPTTLVRRIERRLKLATQQYYPKSQSN